MGSPARSRHIGADPGRPVDLKVRFERFPATIKGAFVLRGTDGQPHAVQLESAEVCRIPSGMAKPIPADEARVDVAPSRDLFLPFEAGISDLDPGWYVVRTRIRVDAGKFWTDDSRPFPVSWPRGEARKGTVRVNKTVNVGGREFWVDRVELAADSASVIWQDTDGRTESPQPAARLLADGVPLEPLPPGALSSPSDFGVPAEVRSSFYPVRRSCRSLHVLVAMPSGEESRRIPVALPLAGA